MRNKQGRCPEKAHYLIKGTLSHIQHVLKQVLKSLLHIFGNILTLYFFHYLYMS